MKATPSGSKYRIHFLICPIYLPLQKTDTASKTGVLSLREHDLNALPDKVYE
jgi:hypothetical protein